MGERWGDSHGYNGQNGHSKEQRLRKDYLLYSRMLLTIDKASGSTTATSSFGGISLTRSMILRLSEEPQPAFR
jgi:hypothetical protein